MLLNRASRYEEAEGLAVAALAEGVGQRGGRDPPSPPGLHQAQYDSVESRRIAERSQLSDISEVTRARHLAWLAYNLMLDDQDGQQRAAADEAAAAAESIGDLESKVIANLTLACSTVQRATSSRALGNLKELCSLGRTSDLPVAHLLSAVYYAIVLASVGRLG